MKTVLAFIFVALALGATWAVFADDAADLKINYVGYDVASGDLVIEGSDFVDARHPAAPSVMVAGRPARVTSYSNDIVTAHVAMLPAGDRNVFISRVSSSASIDVERVSEALWAPGSAALTFNEQRVSSGGN